MLETTVVRGGPVVLVGTDRQFPGIRFRMVDEQGRIRRHMRVFVNDEPARDLDALVAPADELTIMQASSGGASNGRRER